MRRDMRIPSEVAEEDENVFYDEDILMEDEIEQQSSLQPIHRNSCVDNTTTNATQSILRNVTDNVEDNNNEKKEKFISYAKMILPHVGLVVLLILYIFVGATYFYYVESTFELESKEKELRTIFTLRDNFHDNIWNLTHSTDTVISKESFNSIGQEYFEKLVESIFVSYRNQFITERHLMNKTDGDELLWTYPNSVFFATAVVSTIGYGNLVPVTTQGRIGCILFALLGIPLLLVTIADIGKFLSEFLSFLYRTYRVFKRKTLMVGQRTRRFSRFRDFSTSDSCSSPTKAGSVNLNDIEDDSNNGADMDELHIPVIMVLLVLLVYTALGGFLFKAWEGWSYFEAFYFCFTTMATVGFGDLVPTESMYTFLTMVYIIFGLSLATMCIDLAGTEYLQKIHYLGKKMDDAKGAVLSGLEVGEHLIKHNGVGLIKTAGGKFLHIRLSNKQLEELMLNPEKHRDILREPLSAAVQKLADQNNIKILPDDIGDSEGFILKNNDANRPHKKRYGIINQYSIQKTLVPGKNKYETHLLPFVFKESNI